MAFKLTKKQITMLEQKNNHHVHSGARWLTLFSDDFKRHPAWDEVCTLLEIPKDTKEVTITYVATNIDLYE